MQLKDVYVLAKKPVPFSEGPIKDSWFPEISDIESRQYGPASARLAQDGRFVVTEANMEPLPANVQALPVHVLWFDGQPVALMRAVDAGDSDDALRWITDPRAYQRLSAYLWQVLQEDTKVTDIADPEQEVLPEVLFQVRPVHIEDKDAPRPLKKFSFLPHYEKYLVNVPTGHLLLTALASVGEMPQYAQRGKSVMRFVRPVSEQELADNQNLREYTLGGMSQLAWYVECNLPLNVQTTLV